MATPEAAVPAPAPEPAPVSMFKVTEDELNLLTQYVIENSTHSLPGRVYLAVVGAVQNARQRPVMKD